MEPPALRAAVLAFLREANPGAAVERVDDDDDLVALGFMDSLRVMELILVLEEQLGVELELDSIDPRAFQTVSGVCRLARTAAGAR